MEETVIWVTGLIAEILLVVTAVFAVLLQRSRKAQQQLLARLADQEKHPAESVVVADILSETPEAPDAPQIEPAKVEAEPPKTTDVSVTNEFDQLLVSVDDAKMDESLERLQQRLEATTQSLQRLASELQLDSTSSEQGHIEFASLQVNLQEMTKEVDSLQHSNAQLQQDLRGKTQAMERTAAEARENREIVLQHAKKLRGDIVTLRDKLKDSEGDVQRLQSEKEALAAEYAALNKEYERIYSSAQK